MLAATNEGDGQRARLEQWRLNNLTDGRPATLEEAKNELLGAKLSKKEVVDLWDARGDAAAMFGPCQTCLHGLRTNIAFPVLVHFVDVTLFVCQPCEKALTSSFAACNRKRVTEVMNPIRLRTWLNVNGLARRSRCYCCSKTELDMVSSEWHVGHVKSACSGGLSEISNLRPICSDCNLDMGTEDMYEYMERKCKSSRTLESEADGVEMIVNMLTNMTV